MREEHYRAALRAYEASREYAQLLELLDAQDTSHGGGGLGFDSDVSEAWLDWREARHALLVTAAPLVARRTGVAGAETAPATTADLHHAPSLRDFTRGISMCERAGRWREATELVQLMRHTWLF